MLRHIAEVCSIGRCCGASYCRSIELDTDVHFWDAGDVCQFVYRPTDPCPMDDFLNNRLFFLLRTGGASLARDCRG